MAFVYHGSDKGDLNIIVPRVSSHGKRYVYATKHRTIALLFLARWNDYLLTLGTSGEEIFPLTLVERYENAFIEIYGHKAGYLYALNDARFFNDLVCDEFEWVSAHEETPVSCEAIDDIWVEIKEREAMGEIALFHYPDRPANIPADDTDLIQKSVELYELNGDIYNAAYCVRRFPHLKTQMQETFLKLFGIAIQENT